MKKKVCVITGANSGIGKNSAKKLAKFGFHIVMVCKSKIRGEKAKEKIIKETKNKNIYLMIADLSSKKEIKQLVKNFKNRYSKLDILINNAGVILNKRKVTKEGIEKTFAINHLAYFYLTNSLLDLIKKSKGRIINVSSSSHKKGILDDKGKYTGRKAYNKSKLCNILFTKELAKRTIETGITVNCLHPGLVSTNIGNKNPNLSRKFINLAKKILPLSDGSKTIVYLATSKEVNNVTGKYFVRKKEKSPSKYACNPEKAKELWELSEKLTNNF